MLTGNINGGSIRSRCYGSNRSQSIHPIGTILDKYSNMKGFHREVGDCLQAIRIHCLVSHKEIDHLETAERSFAPSINHPLPTRFVPLAIQAKSMPRITGSLGVQTPHHHHVSMHKKISRVCIVQPVHRFVNTHFDYVRLIIGYSTPPKSVCYPHGGIFPTYLWAGHPHPAVM